MNELLLTEDLRTLNSVISHSGVPGMKWYQHKFGDWEQHAKYAAGKSDPDARKKNLLGKVIENRTSRKAVKDAKNDYYAAKALYGRSFLERASAKAKLTASDRAKAMISGNIASLMQTKYMGIESPGHRASMAAWSGAIYSAVAGHKTYKKKIKDYRSRHTTTKDRYALKSDFDLSERYYKSQYRKEYLDTMNKLINGK